MTSVNKHRATVVRPRYGRLALVVVAVTVTVVGVVGGVTESGDGSAVARDTAGASVSAAVDDTLAEPAAPASEPAVEPAPEAAAPVETERILRRDKTVPDGSGDGRLIVFSESRQRVWLIDGDDSVKRTYLVSGSLYDNLDPGSYSVYSRSEQAWGIDDSGTMKYFVRFAHGPNAAIGFHDIPIDDGQLVQTRSQLGTPLSHGCVRQNRPDAIALWDFAPLGTPVVVTV